MKEGRLIREIKDVFKQRLQAKAGWGKNEVEQLLDNVIIDVFAQNIDNDIPEQKKACSQISGILS